VKPNEKLLINLKILGRIPKNGKITKSQHGIISLEAETMLTPLKRFWSQDSRYQAIMEVSQIVDDAVFRFQEMSNSKYFDPQLDPDKFDNLCKYLDALHTGLTDAIVGVENLRFTYKTDVNIVSQLEVILMKMHGCIREIAYVLEDNGYEREEEPSVLTMFPLE
jgi:hypothetical protein